MREDAGGVESVVAAQEGVVHVDIQVGAGGVDPHLCPAAAV